MRIEDLSVVLRPRSGWESVELGFALARRHARVTWLAWLATSLPVFVLLNALGAWLDVMWLPPLLMWWLKPAFERAPLYVMSRGVFGAEPGLRETLRGQFGFARSIWPWLLWLRLSPSRSLLMPVDLLEGVQGVLRRARRQALARNASGTASLLLLVCAHVETVLSLALVGLVLTLTPIEFMEPTAQAVFETLFEDPPLWAQFLLNVFHWFGVSLIAPFYVGAGFALYLNRRTQIEAWDIELGFRRLAARIARQSPMLGLCALALLLAVGGGHPRAAQAADAQGPSHPAAEEHAQERAPSLRTGPEEAELHDHVGPGGSSQGKLPAGDRFRQVFAHEYREGQDTFVVEAAETYEKKALSPVATQSVWLPRDRDPTRPATSRDRPAWLRQLGRGLAFVMENILWVLAAALVVLLIATHRRWLPAFGVDVSRRAPAVLGHESASPARTPLPENLLDAARQLWAEGEPRAALALLYAGGVERVVAATGEPLPPGSTEADCLRRARRLGGEGFGRVFPQVVSRWQAAAYANRLPSESEFRALLEAWRIAESTSAGSAPA